MATRPESLQQARPQLQAIAGVQRVVVDEGSATVLLVCDTEADASAVSEQAWSALRSEGIEQGELALELTVRFEHREGQRVRFIGVDRRMRPDHQVDLTVTLEWQDRTYSASTEAERAEPLELRGVAQAAVDALRQIVPEPLDLRVTGVKQVRSFDAELMVASLFRPGKPPVQYVGAVVAGDDPYRAAAVAVLSALNRMLGNYLAR